MIRTFFVAVCFLLLGLVACSKQSVGQACSRNFNDDDCESGLVCKAPTQGRPEGYCCPPSTIGAPTQCQDVVQIVTDGGTDATTSDGGNDAATDADASDASDASDSGDADTGL